jgi:hypothetical protein
MATCTITAAGAVFVVDAVLAILVTLRGFVHV